MRSIVYHQFRKELHIVCDLSHHRCADRHTSFVEGNFVYTVGVTSFCVRKRNEVDSKLPNEVLALLVTELCPTDTNTKRKSKSFDLLFFLEVPPGFEPGNQSFADSCLTTWLWYHSILNYAVKQ